MLELVSVANFLIMKKKYSYKYNEITLKMFKTKIRELISHQKDIRFTYFQK